MFVGNMLMKDIVMINPWELKITTLIENNPHDTKTLQYEHGLSMYIEVDGLRILFDTGQSGAFWNNADALGIDLDNLDYLMLSHGHYDHTGGVRKLLTQIKKPPVLLVGEGFFEPKYKILENFQEKFIGNSYTEKDLLEGEVPYRILSERVYPVSPKVIIFREFPSVTKYEKVPEKFVIGQGDKNRRDFFSDEIVLGVVTQKGLVVIAGCSHVGIVNILKAIEERVSIPIYGVIGGTHLVEADSERLEKTVQALKEMNIQVLGLSHCTGAEGMAFVKGRCEKEFVFNHTGNVILV